jgi:hypothetical protein
MAMAPMFVPWGSNCIAKKGPRQERELRRAIQPAKFGAEC